MIEKDFDNTKKLTAYVIFNKYFFNRKMIKDIYKYECKIGENIIFNVYTVNEIKNNIYMYDNDYLILFLEYIKYKNKKDDEIRNIYNEIFTLYNIPKNIEIRFEKIIKKYKTMNKKRKNLFLLKKFIRDKFYVDKKNIKIISDHELTSNITLFNIHLYLLKLNSDMYMVEFILFGNSMIFILY